LRKLGELRVHLCNKLVEFFLICSLPQHYVDSFASFGRDELLAKASSNSGTSGLIESILCPPMAD
jgi:hypothetical protein